MPDYHFTGTYPRVLAGLSQGVNATLTPARGEPPVHGATLEASTGDAVHTDEPYDHPELAVVPEDAVPIRLVEDPASDAMTAEGAPAPAEPTA